MSVCVCEHIWSFDKIKYLLEEKETVENMMTSNNCTSVCVRVFEIMQVVLAPLLFYEMM